MGFIDSLTRWWHKTVKTDQATPEPDAHAVETTPPTVADVDSEPASAETARSGNDAYEPHHAEELRESAETPERESDR